ncbi:Cyclin-dependent kinase F-4 [Bienertia sinuspersici]
MSSSNTKIDPISTLYLHPSENTTTLGVELLEGSSNYRTWKRSMELALVTKRKYGFVSGGEKKDSSDKVKAEAWDTCHSVVISWLVNAVSEPIKNLLYLSQVLRRYGNNLR